MRRRSSSISLASKLEEAEEKRNVSAERRRSTAYTLGTGVLEPEVAHGKGTRSLYAEVFPLFLCDRGVEVRGEPARTGGEVCGSAQGRTEPFEADPQRPCWRRSAGDGAQCPFEVQAVGRCPTGAQGQTDGIGQVAGKRPCFQIEAGDELFGFPCGDMLPACPPAMRKPPALSFQSERKAFTASGRAAVNSPSGRRVLTAGAGLAADGFAPGIASPMPPEEVTRTSGASTDKVLTEAERACVSKCRPLKVSARIRTAGEPASFPALRSAAERLLPRPKDSALTEASAPVTAREVAEAGAAGV